MKRVALATALALAVVAGACGSSSAGGSGVASLSGEQAAAPAAGSSQQGEKDREEAALAFARCMRENGVDMPDPAGGRIMLRGPAGPGAQDAMEKAQEACKTERQALEGAAGDPPADLQDQMLAMARCMRSKGIDMRDPEPGRGGRFRVEGNPDELDSEAFREASEACRKQVGLAGRGPGAVSGGSSR